MTDAILRNYLGVLSFLLAALSFLANERRGAIESLREAGTVSKGEKCFAVLSAGLVFLAALGLVFITVPAVCGTDLGLDDVLRLNSVVREAFVMGWLLLIAITLALAGLVKRALGIASS